MLDKLRFVFSWKWDKKNSLLKKVQTIKKTDKEIQRTFNCIYRFLVFYLFFLFFSGCQMSYLWRVSLGQMELLENKIAIEKALKKYEFSEVEKEKLLLISEIKLFAREKLQLDIDEDLYSSYVHLNRPYVSYLLRVSPIYELKAYEWHFPVIGATPYKGFFCKERAKREAKSFPIDEYDIYIRGVNAYSTLGWFSDPVFSSMLSYSNNDFVIMIFHELAHTILFFKNHIDFNERFAEFLGRKMALAFYLKKEGPDSKVVKTMHKEWRDELFFSSFIVREYQSLSQWYKDNKGKITPEMKQKRIKEIQNRFVVEIQPQLETNRYNYFLNIQLNNARLLSFRSYSYNMVEFEKVFTSPLVNKNIKIFVNYCTQFEKEENPEEAFSKAVAQIDGS